MSGRHFLQIPGPTNVPAEVLAALASPTIDHRSSEFSELTGRVLSGLRRVVGATGPTVLYPSSGSGAWEAALVNTLSPGDHVLVAETGFFSQLWAELAGRLGLTVHTIPGDWRAGADPDAVAEILSSDSERRLRAVAVVHNETSTGVMSRIPAIRSAIDASGHDALLLVDTISSLGSATYHHDDWGVDVTVGCSQKGLQLPPGLGFNVVSEKALNAHAVARLPRSYWDWEAIIKANQSGLFPYTPPTNMLFALDVAIDLLLAEGMENVVRRHQRHSAATRAAVQGWGFDIQCSREDEYSVSLTAVRMPGGEDEVELRRIVKTRFDTSLGGGLGKLQGSVFRIGHLGAFNDPMLIGTLGAVEAALVSMGLVEPGSGLTSAITHLAKPVP